MSLGQQDGSKRCWVLLREEEVCVCGFCPDLDLGLCGFPRRRPELRGDTCEVQKDSGHRTHRELSGHLRGTGGPWV